MKRPPGTIVSSVPDDSDVYIGSPSIVSLPDRLVVTHDYFGATSDEHITVVWASFDDGSSWAQQARMAGQWWSTLFAIQDELYLIGVRSGYGDLVIRRSEDRGVSWTSLDNSKGTLSHGRFHTAPTAIVFHQDRVWKAVERRTSGSHKHDLYSIMYSAPVGSDLLDPNSWSSGPWHAPPTGIQWLEGNAVVTPKNHIATLLRAKTGSHHEQAILIEMGGSFQRLTLPGGAKKFTVRFDSTSRKYLALVNPSSLDIVTEEPDPGRIRNTLVLASSTNLTDWYVDRVLLYHADWRHSGFQYADWIRVGDRLATVVRTSFRNPPRSDRSAMASNHLTFHWFDLTQSLR